MGAASCSWALIAWGKYTESFDFMLESCDACPATPTDANYHCPNDDEYVDEVDCCPAQHEESGPHNSILRPGKGLSLPQLQCPFFVSQNCEVDSSHRKKKWQIFKGPILTMVFSRSAAFYLPCLAWQRGKHSCEQHKE